MNKQTSQTHPNSIKVSRHSENYYESIFGKNIEFLVFRIMKLSPFIYTNYYSYNSGICHY